MSSALITVVGAGVGVGVGLLTNRLNSRLTAGEPEADGAPLPLEAWWAPVLDAVAVAVAGYRFGVTAAGVAAALLLVLLVHILMFDARHRLILNVVIYPAIAAALLLAPVNPLLASGSIQNKLLSATTGALLGGGVFYFLVVVSGGGLGMGDAKLMFFLGAALGLFPLPGSPLIRTVVYGILLGAVVAVVLLVTRIRGLRDYIAYGPYLCLGAMIELVVFGPPLPGS